MKARPNPNVDDAFQDLAAWSQANSDGYPRRRWNKGAAAEAALIHAMAKTVAQRYANGVYEFEFANFVANTLWSNWIEDAVELGSIPLLRDVYDAFDAGEWPEADGGDPVERHTDPMIASILSKLPAR